MTADKLLVGIAAAILLAAGGCSSTNRSAAAPNPAAAISENAAARRVILLIGDGLGDSEITMARNYHAGAAGRLALDRLPVTGALTTYTLREDDPTRPNYVGDSAATATAWATGRRTSNGRLSTAAGSDAPLATIVELAHAAGIATGSVTTAEVTDATPAALMAHVTHRSCEGPADMEKCPRQRTAAGGPGSIAEQAVVSGIDVLLGGGRGRFEQTVEAGPAKGQTVVQTAAERGYTVLTDAAGLEAAAKAEASAPARVLGLFAPGHMTVEWTGDPAKAFPGSGPQRCSENRRPAGEPSLAQMTSAALAHLERAGRKGFFLQIEGASIDKCSHAADPCGQIGETIAFDAAVALVAKFAETHPDTLVIVTGDHAHSGQIVAVPKADDHGPGLLSTLTTADGAEMTVSYATNLAGHSQGHTGTQVRVAAQGPGAETLAGVHEQTELFDVIAAALGLAAAPGK